MTGGACPVMSRIMELALDDVSPYDTGLIAPEPWDDGDPEPTTEDDDDDELRHEGSEESYNSTCWTGTSFEAALEAVDAAELDGGGG